MFTEELAREIGIAYSLYCLDCEEKGVSPMAPIDFTEFSLSKIEEIRNCKGLNRDDVFG